MQRTDHSRDCERLRGQRLSAKCGSLLVPLQPAGTKDPIFLFAGGLTPRPEYLALQDAQFFTFIKLIRDLGMDQPVYGVRRFYLESVFRSYRSLEQLAVSYADAVLSLQPHGPHLLIGHCIGGIFAYETARRLSLASSEVNLVLIDTPFPDRFYQEGLATYFDTHEESLAHDEALASKVKKNWKQLAFTRDSMYIKGLYMYNKIMSFCIRRMKQCMNHYASLGLCCIWRSRIMNMLSDYDASHYKGRLSLVLTDELYERGVKDCWDKVAVNGLEFYRIPRDHEHCMIESLHVVGNIIREFTKSDDTPNSGRRR